MRIRTNQRVEWASCYCSFCKMLGYWIGIDSIPKNLPKSVSGIEMQNQMDKSIKYKEMGITPILLLHPSKVPWIVLHRRTPTYLAKTTMTTAMPIIWKDKPMRTGWHSGFAPYHGGIGGGSVDINGNEQPLGFRFVDEEVVMLLPLLVPPFLKLNNFAVETYKNVERNTERKKRKKKWECA